MTFLKIANIFKKLFLRNLPTRLQTLFDFDRHFNEKTYFWRPGVYTTRGVDTKIGGAFLCRGQFSVLEREIS